MRIVDYLIVGQGIAGSSLAFRLINAGKSIRILDSGLNNGASMAAAGLINPITGRNYVKTWLYETLLPELNTFYTELEQVTGLKLVRDVRILRALLDAYDQNKWMSKSTQPEYDGYLGEIIHKNTNRHSVLRSRFPLAEIRNGKLVDIPLLLNALRKNWAASSILHTDHFIAHKLSFQRDHYQYDDIRTKQIIFCEGNEALRNPYFKYLPIISYAGEALKVKIPALQPEYIVKQKFFLIPVGRDLFWFGPYNHPHNLEIAGPSARGREMMEQALKDIVMSPFEVVEQVSGVRPTVEDRRPLLGTHPQFPGLHIFNGLGTKGASLAPYFSRLFMEYLLWNRPIPKTVNIDRFNLNNGN